MSEVTNYGNKTQPLIFVFVPSFFLFFNFNFFFFLGGGGGTYSKKRGNTSYVFNINLDVFIFTGMLQGLIYNIALWGMIAKLMEHFR